MRPIKFILAAAGLFAASLGTAQAGAIVTDWNYAIASEWSSANSASGVGTQTISWGTPQTPAGQSNLVITTPGGNQNHLQTYIGGGLPPQVPYWADAGSVTHNNNVITNSTLTSAVLSATLWLEAASPILIPGTPGSLGALNINIAFKETTNGGVCDVASSPTPCNDIFVLTSGLPNQSFDFDGNTYFLNIFPSNSGSFSVLDANVCAAAGQAAGCIGFTTPENESTNVPFAFTISTKPLSVPEPGVLSLAGLALVGAAVAGRRRRAQR